MTQMNFITNPVFAGISYSRDIGGAGLPLDGVSSVLALTLEKMCSDYTDACLRVRNNATNAESDIGFDSDGDLDWSLLAAKGSDLRLVKWYSGDGSGQYAGQTDHAKQPYIDQTKKCITFDGSNDFLVTPSLNLSNSGASLFSRLSANGAASVQIVCETGASLSDGGFVLHFLYGNYDHYIQSGSSQTNKRIAVPTSDFHTLSVVMNKTLNAANAVAIRVDGSSAGSGQDALDAPSGTFAANILNIGSRNGGNYFASMSLKSLIITNVSENAATRDAIESAL